MCLVLFEKPSLSQFPIVPFPIPKLLFYLFSLTFSSLSLYYSYGISRNLSAYFTLRKHRGIGKQRLEHAGVSERYEISRRACSLEYLMGTRPEGKSKLFPSDISLWKKGFLHCLSDRYQVTYVERWTKTTKRLLIFLAKSKNFEHFPIE